MLNKIGVILMCSFILFGCSKIDQNSPTPKSTTSSCSEPKDGWAAYYYKACSGSVNGTEAAFNLKYTDSDRVMWIRKCMETKGYECDKGDWIKK